MIALPGNKSFYSWIRANTSGVKYGSTYTADQGITVYLKKGYYETIKAESNFQGAYPVDIDGDGNDEIVKINNNSDNSSSVIKISKWKWEQKGMYANQALYDIGSFTVTTESSDFKSGSFTSPEYRAYLFGDFDGNGKSSLLIISFGEDINGKDRDTYAQLVDIENGKMRGINKSFFKIRPKDQINLVDFDGDGILELAHISDTSISIYKIKPNDASFTLLTSLPLQSNEKNVKKFLFADINGDGKTDIIISPRLSIIQKRYVHKGDCVGCCSLMATSPEELERDGNFPVEMQCGDSKKCVIAGVEEYYVVDGGDEWTIYHSDGKSMVNQKKLSLFRHWETNSYFFMDADKNGLLDLMLQNVRKSQLSIHLNTNGIINKDASYSKNGYNGIYIPSKNINSYQLKNGSLMKLYKNSLQVLSNAKDINKERLMVSTINSLGIITKYYYSKLSNRDVYKINFNHLPTYPYAFIHNDFLVATKEEIYNDKLKVLSSNTYSYENGIINKNGLGFCGFLSIQKHDNLSLFDYKTLYNPEKYSILEKEEGPTSSADYKYSIDLDASKKLKILLTKKTSYDKLNDNTIISTIDSYDSYGNILKSVVDYGNNIKEEKTFAYSNIDEESKPYILGLPTSEEVKITRDGKSISTKTLITYKNIYLPESKKQYVDNNQAVEENYTYDKNQLRSISTRSYSSQKFFSTKYEYDSYGRIVKTIDPLGFTTTSIFDSKGFLSQQIDYKNRGTQYSYNNWGQLIKTIYPDKTESNTVGKWENSSPIGALYKITTTATGQSNTEVYYDAAGRIVREGEMRFDGQYLYIDKWYNDKGQLLSTSLPFKGSAPVYWNRFIYDTYDRVRTIAYASGKTDIYSYDKNKVTSIIDGVTISKITDATGLTVNVIDEAGTIVYKYRPDGQPSAIVPPKKAGLKDENVTTSFEYDKYGRQIAIIDPSAGRRSYEYDADGNLIKETDADDRVTEMGYDQFNRIITKKIKELTTSYSYNLKSGLLESVSNANSKVLYTYNEYDQVKNQKETILDGKWFEQEFVYNNGNLSDITYKANTGNIATENYIYTNGHNTEIKLNNSTSIWKLTAENSQGIITASTTGVYSRTYGYDNYGLPTSRVLKSGVTTIQNFGYNIDPKTGNLTWRKDNTRNITEYFGYDNLNRLRTGGNSNAIKYDVMGNINSKSDVGSFGYEDQSRPYAISNATSSVIPINTQEIKYNAMLRPTSIKENGYEALLFYNEDGERLKMHLKKNNATQWLRYYWGAKYEQDVESITGNKERLYLGGDAYSAPVVYVKQNGKWEVQYICRDYLGSITHVINTSGPVLQELSYDAWGRLRNPKDQKSYDVYNEPIPVLGRGYTGHEHLPMFGLINMNARLYDPVVGRFLSPDPYVQAPHLSQNFNRYSYVLNNPLRYNDPSGEWFGLDDLVIAGAGFAFGYVGHGLSTGNWGTDALVSGLIGAGTAWLGYNTAGLANAAGTISSSTWTHVGNMAINTVASQFMPSYNIPLGDFSIGISPTIGLGSGGLTTGANLGLGYSDGNFSMSGAVGFGANGLRAKNGYIGWSANAMYRGYVLGYGRTSYSASEINGNSLGSQVVGTATAYFNYNSFAFSNDALGDGEDRYRTFAAELTLGNYSIGTHLYTNWGSRESDNETNNRKVPVIGFNKKGAWTNGQVYSAPLWVGYRKDNQITRIGFSHKIIQNFTQNGTHKFLTPTPFFLDYDKFKTAGYIYSGAYNPLSLW